MNTSSPSDVTDAYCILVQDDVLIDQRERALRYKHLYALVAG